MSAPLVSVIVPSCYKNASGLTVPLPSRMARCAPDLAVALERIANAVAAEKGLFRLSDLYRSYEMQLQAHLDYASGKKKAYSPPPGGSMHEGGRAFDVDVAALGVTLARFWEIAAAHGVVPIIAAPDPGASECWHFEARGSHARVYAYYAAGKGKNMKPYAAMAASAILATGVDVPRFGDSKAAALQSALIRLGADIGSIDGQIGPRSLAALAALGVTGGSTAALLSAVEEQLRAAFPGEHDASALSFGVRDSDDERLFWEADVAPAYLRGD